MGNMLKNVFTKGLSRRNFIASSAAVMAGLGVPGLGGCGTKVMETTKPLAKPKGEWVPALCWAHCGGKCSLQVYKEDNVLTRTKTDDTHEDSYEWPQARACLKGRTRVEEVLGADRLKYPMKRKNWKPGGKEVNGHLRGIDEWERISWDEALDIVASEITRIKKQYGNRAIFGPGVDTSLFSNDAKNISYVSVIRDIPWCSVLNAYGGQVMSSGTASAGAFVISAYYGYGNGIGSDLGSDRFEVQDCEYYVLLGENAAYSCDTTTMWSTMMPLKGPNKKFYIIDPFYNDTMATLGAEWVPIRPGTDLPFMNAMAYVMLTEDNPDSNPLIDWDFLERCAIGFDADHMPKGISKEENFKDYILGTYDGQPKNPEWASAICGIAPEKIREIARVLGKNNKVCLNSAWALGRTHNAESAVQMIMILGAMGGHFGKPGHVVSSATRSLKLNHTKSIIKIPTGTWPYIANPIDDTIWDPVLWKSILDKKYTWSGWGLFDHKPAEEREIDIKCIYHYAMNKIHRSEYQMGGIEAHRRMEFVVCNAIDFNLTARYSDIVLPINSPWETYPMWSVMDNYERIVMVDGILPQLYESKTSQWVGEELLKRWGIDPKIVFPKTWGQTCYELMAELEVLKEDGKTYEKLLSFTAEEIAEFDAVAEPQKGRIPFAEFRKKGVYSVKRRKGDNLGAIALQEFCKDPEKHPLRSASGKMEFHCQTLSDHAKTMGFAELSPLPKYVPPVNGYQETFLNGNIKSGKKAKYPFQLFTPHYIRSSHSIFDNIPALREACDRPAMMNELDAAEYGLKNGDIVRVYNEWGSSIRPLYVTKRLMRGVLAFPYGGVVNIDEETGYDIGGSANILCAPRMTATRVSGYNTQVAAVELYTGKFKLDVERLSKAPDCQK